MIVKDRLAKAYGIVTLSDPRQVTTFHINLDQFLNYNLMHCLNKVEEDFFQLYVEYDLLPDDCSSAVIFDHNIDEDTYKYLYEICAQMEEEYNDQN